MTVLTGSTTAEAWARASLRLAGLALGAVGLALGVGVIWTQLARALPLGELVHHPRAVRAMLVAGAGLGLLFLGRRGSPRPQSRQLVGSFGSWQTMIETLRPATRPSASVTTKKTFPTPLPSAE